jgi:hypothetical protein
MNFKRVLPFVAASALLLTIGCGNSPGTTTPSASTIYVIQGPTSTEPSSILELPVNGQGSVTPTATIYSPKKTAVFTAVTVDQAGNIYAGAVDYSASTTPPDEILVYAPGAATPTRILTGLLPLYQPIESLGVDAFGDVYVFAGLDQGLYNMINVYAPNASGAATPVRVIGGDNTILDDVVNYRNINHYAIDLDGAGNIYFLDEDSREIIAFAPTAANNALPTSVFPVLLHVNDLFAVTIDAAGDSFAVGYPDAQGNYVIWEYPPGGGTGPFAPPIRTISFTTSNNPAINGPPAGIAVDAAGNLYISFAADFATEPLVVYVFPPGSSGLSTPSQTITTAAWTGPNNGQQIAVH